MANIYKLRKAHNNIISQTVICLMLFIVVPSLAFSQAVPVYQQRQLKKDTSVAAYTSDTLHHRTKHFGRGAIEFGLAEVVPWSFDKFLKKADYANISFKTVGNNLKPSSWTWDDDNFQTNQFGHPYQGSLFYNSFR